MPHRKNAKGDIGSLQRFSDTYDMDNVYLSEEGWVYRHFKNSERSLWWDEILVAGQVKPGMEIHGVNNNPVVPTNPLKLGTAGQPADSTTDPLNPVAADGGVDYPEHNLFFEDGDGYPDYRYSDHDRAPDKITEFTDPYTTTNAELYKRIDFEETAWESINVEDPELHDLSTQVPNGWTTTTDPSDVVNFPDEPPYEGEAYQSINHYTVDNPDYLASEYKYATVPMSVNPESGAVVEPGVFPENSGPMVADEDYIADPDGPADAFDSTLETDAPDLPTVPAPDDENPVQPIVP